MPTFGFPIKPSIISVHIPKTAGSSFHAALKQHFGWRLKHIQKPEDIRTFSRGEKYKSNKPFVQAVHGHIRPHENWKLYYPSAKWVCWLRDPVDRVVSAYHHLQRTQDLGDRNQKLFKELQPDLKIFTQLEAFKPVTRIYQHFLGNFSPSDFAFVGRTEKYNEDMARFEVYFGISKLLLTKVNVATQSHILDDETSAFLKTELAAEYEIYQSFIKAIKP